MTMQDDLMTIAALKEQIKDLGEELEERQQALVADMESSGQVTITANAGDLKGTLVKGSTISTNADALKKAIGARLWGKVTKQVLDKEKLEAHIATGDIDANVVASVSTEKDSKPYIRISGNRRPRKKAAASTKGTTIKNSAGGTKPAAKRVRRAAKKP